MPHCKFLFYPSPGSFDEKPHEPIQSNFNALFSWEAFNDVYPDYSLEVITRHDCYEGEHFEARFLAISQNLKRIAIEVSINKSGQYTREAYLDYIFEALCSVLGKAAPNEELVIAAKQQCIEELDKQPSAIPPKDVPQCYLIYFGLASPLRINFHNTIRINLNAIFPWDAFKERYPELSLEIAFNHEVYEGTRSKGVFRSVSKKGKFVSISAQINRFGRYTAEEYLDFVFEAICMALDKTAPNEDEVWFIKQKCMAMHNIVSTTPQEPLKVSSTANEINLALPEDNENNEADGDDELDYGVNIETASPKALSLFPKDSFFWDCVDELAPFGSDEGDTALDEWRQWRKDNKNTPALEYLQAMIGELSGKPFTAYNESIATKKAVKALYNDDDVDFEYEVDTLDISIIATGFGQLLDEGCIDMSIKLFVEIAINRQLMANSLDRYNEEVTQKYNQYLHELKAALALA